MVWLSELQKYGVGFTAGGVVFFLLGVVTFFDAALLALGNVSLGLVACLFCPVD